MSVKTTFVVTEVRRGHGGGDRYCEVLLAPKEPKEIPIGTIPPVQPANNVAIRGRIGNGHPSFSTFEICFRDGREAHEFDLGDEVEIVFTSLGHEIRTPKEW